MISGQSRELRTDSSIAIFMCSPSPRRFSREQNTHLSGHFEVSSIQMTAGPCRAARLIVGSLPWSWNNRTATRLERVLQSAGEKIRSAVNHCFAHGTWSHARVLDLEKLSCLSQV